MEEGRRYNNGKLEWNLIDFKQLEDQVRVLMYGAHKYTIYEGPEGPIKGSEISTQEAASLPVLSSGKDNWKGGLSLRDCADSMLRHYFAFMSGEDNDPESGLPHLGHIGCNLMFMTYIMKNQPGRDDRPIKKD